MALVNNEDGEYDKICISTASKEDTMSLTILKPLPFLLSTISNNINHLQPSTKYQIINNNKSRIFRSFDTRLSERIISPMLVKLTVHSKVQYGVLTKFADMDHYIINYLNDNMIEESSTNFAPLKYSNDIIRNWSTSLNTTKQNDLKLSMSPPVNNSPIKATSMNESNEVINDPFDYFLDRYFDNLYLLTTPLTFFTKSAFTRLRTLCADNFEYESILKQFIIDHESFDNRHTMSNNGILNSSLLYEKENIYRKNFIQKSLNLIDFDIHSSTSTETNKTLSNVLNNFKIRELHLQILLLLELVHISGRDNVKYFKKPSKKTHLTKKSLVGRRKLTPTISGTAVPNLENTNSTNVKLSFNQILDVYIDKLCIWDVLMGTSSLDNSTPIFMSYIIVPYFNKKCPNSVKYMLKKVKGPSFRSKSTSSGSSSSSKINFSDGSKPSLKRSASISSTSSSTASSSSDTKRPSLSRTSSNIKLEDIQELKTSLSRSNSDLQSLNRTASFNTTHLSRRQVDMSLPPIPSEHEQAAALKRQNSSIFNRVGKKSSMTTNSATTSTASGNKKFVIPTTNETFSQVDATPMKATKYVNPLIDQTPKDKENNIVMSSSPIEYAKTPKVLQTPTIIRSSVKKPGDPVDFNNPDEVPQLMGSPISKDVRRRLFAPPK